MLAEIRELQGIRKSLIAEKIGVHPSSVGRLEAGIPALSAEYISKICAILSINEAFLYEKSDYPFLPQSFLIFRVKGLKVRFRPLGWLELLSKYTSKLKVLLLLPMNKENVVAACVQDDKDSVFLISVEIPTSYKTVFEYRRKQPEDKIDVVANGYFDAPNVLSHRHSFSDIATYPRDMIQSMIEDAFASSLTIEERNLIRIVRKNKIPIEKMIECAKIRKNL